MELRDLQAFVTAAHELHFARAAARLYLAPSTMSELIAKLEVELGAALFVRTTRRIVLTDAGAALLPRAEVILELVADAASAVAATARDDTDAVRLGITPPAATVIAPHLAGAFTRSHPTRSVETVRMWLPALAAALQAGAVDFALTCGDLPTTDPDITTIGVGSEPLLVGLRPEDPLVTHRSLDLRQMEHRTLGVHPAHLFPAWHAVQRQTLLDAGLAPPTAELEDPDLSARRWIHQAEVDWIMLTASLLGGHDGTTVRPVDRSTIPYTLSWRSRPEPAHRVSDFATTASTIEPPLGWTAPVGAARRP